MKRDNDYLRELLLRMEGSSESYCVTRRFLGMKPEDQKEPYHLDLLCDARLVAQVGNDAYRLTSEGHDFINAIRDPGKWQMTKEKAAEIGGEVAIAVIKAIAIGLLNS